MKWMLRFIDNCVLLTYIEFGSSYKISDFIVDLLEHWWSQLSPATQQAVEQIPRKVDNGPESRYRWRNISQTCPRLICPLNHLTSGDF
ncbi:MAG: hypothetical protein F6K00_22060 [Leptolyngbya sp. SIOISBB]|nr:hypothetical protein [Leptolyngbya sp. SIOISBB]